MNRAKLSGAILKETQMTEVNLSSAYLLEVDLQGFDLSGVNFSQALMTRINLQDSDLTAANLSQTQSCEMLICGRLIYQRLI